MSARFRRGRLALPALAVVLALGGAALAQDAYRVRAFVQPEGKIVDDRPFQLVIQIEGEQSPKVSPPRLEGLENLSTLGPPGTSSQFYWSNGQASSQLQLIYRLLPDGPGRARIPAVEMDIGGTTYRTEPIEITVEKALPGPASSPARPDAPRAPDDAEAADGNLVLRAELGADETWVGQPIPLTVTLYVDEVGRIGSIDGWRRQPSFDDFWVEDVDVNPEAEKYRTRLGGREVVAYPLVRKLLVPPSPGTFTVDPWVLQLRVRPSRGDMFDLFSMARGRELIRRTEPLEIRVRQLPGGAPEGFGGAVGNFTMRVSLDRNEAVENDAVALRATVEGEGVLTTVEPPTFDPPPNLKVFDPKVTESTVNARGQVRSRKTWEWLVVPLAAGDLELPELRFAYFDPARASYEIARQAPPTLTVQRGERQPGAQPARGDIRLERRDLAFIKALRGPLREEHLRVDQRALFRVLLVLPFVLTPLAILLGRRQARLRSDRGRARARKAAAVARKRLRAVRRRRDRVDSAAFHEEVARTLVEYVADRFDRAAAGLTYELADDLLAGRKVPQELRGRYRTCLETCDFARFVPASAKPERQFEVLEQAAKLIDDLERAW